MTSFLDGPLLNLYILLEYYSTHPSADDKNFTFQGSTNTGSSYGVTITSTLFQALHFEADNEATVEYEGGGDLAQSTSYQEIIRGFDEII